MKKILVILIFFATFTGISHAQEDVVQNIEKMSLVHQDKITTQEYALKLQRYLILKPYILDGDTMYQYLLPELPVYAPLKFKNNRQRKNLSQRKGQWKRWCTPRVRFLCPFPSKIPKR